MKTYRFAAMFLLALLFIAPQLVAQQRDLDALAAETGAAISLSAKNTGSDAKVLVLDFVPQHQGSRQLGLTLADQFSDSLRKHSLGFRVIGRDGYLATFADDSAFATAFESRDAMTCYTNQLGANVFVDGMFDPISDSSVSVWVGVRKDDKLILEKRTVLTLTPELQDVASKPELRMEGSGAPVIWISKDRPPKNAGKAIRLPNPSDSAMKQPACLHCPPPEFSCSAELARYQGTAVFDVEIDKEGFPIEIAPLRTLPCGLTRKAVEALSNWRFSPAIGSDGNPTAVFVAVEVTFKLF